MSELKGMSYAELRALLEETEAALALKRAEELKVLADGYAKKLQMGGFGIAEGIEALKPYLPAKPAKSAAKYANPDDPTQTWVGMGKPPQWFKDQLANGRTREDLLVP